MGQNTRDIQSEHHYQKGALNICDEFQALSFEYRVVALDWQHQSANLLSGAAYPVAVVKAIPEFSDRTPRGSLDLVPERRSYGSALSLG